MIDKIRSLKDLYELCEKGILATEDFEKKKSEILKNIQVESESEKIDVLIELHNLVKLNVISEDEFQKKKSQLLGLNHSATKEPVGHKHQDLKIDDFEIENEESTIVDNPTSDKPKVKPQKKSNKVIIFTLLGLLLVGGLLYLGYWYYRNYYVNLQDLGDTVLFYEYEDNDKNIVAVPIAIYLDGKFHEPPYSMDNGVVFQSESTIPGEPNATDLSYHLKSSITASDVLYSIHNGKRIQEINIRKQSLFGLSDASYIVAVLGEEPSYSVLVDNPNIGNSDLMAISDKPNLQENLTVDENYLENELIAEIDFDGDNYPELVYKCITYEGSFYKIYSYANGNWYMIYSGGYIGY